MSLSDHYPISAVVKCDIPSVITPTKKVRYNWSKADLTTYKQNLRVNLKSIDYPVMYMYGILTKDPQTSYRWYLGVEPLKVVDHYNYLGVTISANGTSVLGLLKGYGFHRDGLSPLTRGTVYNIMVSPSMLYGCEVWGAIPQTEMRTLEVVHKRVAKHIQRLHDDIVRGMLGWLPISAVIDLCKIAPQD